MVATRLLCPWNSPGNGGVGCHSLLQGIFPDIPPKSWQNLTLLSLTCTVLGSYWAQMTCTSALVAQTVKRLPAMWETWVQSLGQEDLLEKEMATHSSTLAWKVLWMEEPGRLQSMGLQRVGYDWATSLCCWWQVFSEGGRNGLYSLPWHPGIGRNVKFVFLVPWVRCL